MLRLDTCKRGGLVVLLGQRPGLVQLLQTPYRVLVAVLSCLLIPDPCLSDVFWHMDTNFIVVTHREFAGGQTCIRGHLCVLES